MEKPQFSSSEHYKKLFTEDERSEHLSEEKAHELVNMLRVTIGVSPGHTGRIPAREQELAEKFTGGEIGTIKEFSKANNEYPNVTKEDYENALKIVEGMEQLAEEETAGERFNFLFKQILRAGGYTLIEALMGGVSLVSLTENGELNANELLEKIKKNKKSFVDAKTSLNRLIKEGDKFGKLEKKYNTEKILQNES